MKVIITGGAGFIGSHLADRLLGEGHEVVIVDDLSAGKRQNIPAQAKFPHPIDITHQQRLWDAFDQERPDAVCHYAARIDVAHSMKRPSTDAMVNVVGALNVLEASLEFGVSRFVFASTGGAIYGNPERLPVPEEWPAGPLAPYGVAKLAFEHYLRVYQDRLPSISLRYANVYGPRQDPSGETGVVGIFANRIHHGKDVKLYGDGTATRDYVYVSDAVDAACRALASSHTGIYNIGSGQQTSVLDLIQALREVIGADVPIEFCSPRLGDVRHIALDSMKAGEELGWSAQILLREGLKAVIESQKQGEEA